MQLKIIKRGDKEYPEKLNYIYAPPAKLYVLGDEKLLNQTGIAIVGCRQCSLYGSKVAQKFAYELTKRKINVISGLATGIDTYAHKGAIEKNGKTIAVLGSGFNHVYPKENIPLCQEILKKGGAVISEYEPKQEPRAINFPSRNRIISGLSSGVLIIEAREKSGSFITVDCALEQGKNVYAVPGNITRDTSYGTNHLIQQGAKLVLSIEDILEEL